MRLSHKVGKLATAEAFESARVHLSRAVLPRGRGTVLDPEKLIQTIDQQGLATIRARHAVDHPGDAWPKYLDLTKWMDKNILRVRDLELDFGFRKRVLDLGCGAGYFLYISKLLGHDVVGLDIDEVPMYGEMFEILGLERVIARVEPFAPLPPFGHKFDLITAFMICFNGHKSAGLWGPQEWTYFLEDLESRLRPNGRICLGFNREEDGSYYNEELREFFAERGAEMEGERVTLTPRRRRRRRSAA